MKKLLLLLTVLCCLGNLTATAQQKVVKTTPNAAKAKAPKPLTMSTSLSPLGKGGGGGGPVPVPVLPDSDGDGVTDQFDQEQTPAGCPVDTHGVSRDTDGDGVPDCRDKELITPTICQPVDADGVGTCPTGVITTDSDGDGVADQYDQEPTPAGCPVDTHGVSRDTDGDGVPDCRDKELITPTVCQPVDADGVGKCPCPENCGSPTPTAAANSTDRHGEANQQDAFNKNLLEQMAALKDQLEQITLRLNSMLVAVGKEDKSLGLRAYSMPNPATNYFTIRTQSGSSQPLSLRVLDATGKLIEERSGISANGALRLGEQYRSGTYLVEVQQGSEKATLRLVKQLQ